MSVDNTLNFRLCIIIYMSLKNTYDPQSTPQLEANCALRRYHIDQRLPVRLPLIVWFTVCSFNPKWIYEFFSKKKIYFIFSLFKLIWKVFLNFWLDTKASRFSSKNVTLMVHSSVNRSIWSRSSTFGCNFISE